MNIELENYGTAKHHADNCIDCDPNYSKAYFKRGLANELIGRKEEALKDFERVIDLIRVVFNI